MNYILLDSALGSVIGTVAFQAARSLYERRFRRKQRNELLRQIAAVRASQRAGESREPRFINGG